MYARALAHADESVTAAVRGRGGVVAAVAHLELEALGRDEFIRILTEPRNALVKQYIALMETEGIEPEFTEEAIHRIADGKIAEHWSGKDELGLMIQLGVIEPPGQPG